jgi:hypothetical protein
LQVIKALKLLSSSPPFAIFKATLCFTAVVAAVVFFFVVVVSVLVWYGAATLSY